MGCGIWVWNGSGGEIDVTKGLGRSALVFEGTPNLPLDSGPGQSINDLTPNAKPHSGKRRVLDPASLPAAMPSNPDATTHFARQRTTTKDVIC